MAASQSEKDDKIGEEEEDTIKYWWHVNKSGFPICQETWDRMWSHIAMVHPNGHEIALSIREKANKKVPPPSVPYLTDSATPQEAMIAIQTYLQELQYNYTGTQFFDVNKSRPLSRLMELAKEMIRESLPIKCLEAVVLSLYLSAPVLSLQRFPIGFKSLHNGRYHRHIVLGCYSSGLYGAIGLSRRPTLMYKPLDHKLLSELLEDFTVAYQECGHSVTRIKIGAPIVHNVHSCEEIQWKLCVVQLRDGTLSDVKKTIEKFSKVLRTCM